MFVTKAMQVFIALYQEKSLKAAADKLCLTVPPVTRMLKLTEDWLGERLFVSERNHLIPTPAADCAYRRLYPHYSALKQFHFEQENGFRISSPLVGGSVIPNLLTMCPANMVGNFIVRNASSMHLDDDIFISMMPSIQLPEFESYGTDMVLELQCSDTLEDRWRNIALLSEQGIDQLPQFKQVLEDMISCGHNGKVRRIDNPVWLNEVFERGEGLCFRRPHKAAGAIRALPFIIHLPLFIYVNSNKKTSLHDNFLAHIKNKIH